jgi:hypothetical protein
MGNIAATSVAIGASGVMAFDNDVENGAHVTTVRLTVVDGQAANLVIVNVVAA